MLVKVCSGDVLSATFLGHPTCPIDVLAHFRECQGEDLSRPRVHGESCKVVGTFTN